MGVIWCLGESGKSGGMHFLRIIIQRKEEGKKVTSRKSLTNERSSEKKQMI